jgi:5'-3' exonuclease
MGVPKFFAWLAQKCPQMIHPVTRDSIVDVGTPSTELFIYYLFYIKIKMIVEA